MTRVSFSLDFIFNVFDRINLENVVEAPVTYSLDNATLNAMIREEIDERALATQVQKHGPSQCETINIGP